MSAAAVPAMPGAGRMGADALDALESEVRTYCRRWPAVFARASGSWLYGEDGTPYLDFFAGAGALNYGHNNAVLKRALIDYLASDGVVHALDMWTVAKRNLLTTVADLVLKPRGLDYKILFPGPGGANAVEAALKLARKATGRRQVVYFGDAFHGMTLGALSVTGTASGRSAAGVPLGCTTAQPYSRYVDGRPELEALERVMAGRGGAAGRPAAAIVEVMQAEGGMVPAGVEWVRGLAELCRRHDVVLIVDDVQMGCGRTGSFFSFETAGIVPDVVCLSKSISGYGLPLALLLVRPSLDVFRPGEHTGTFRGFNGAFVTGTEALRHYWRDDLLEKSTSAKGDRLDSALRRVAGAYPQMAMAVRGRGLAYGLRFGTAGDAYAVSQEAYRRGLLVETCGPAGETVKLIPPLTLTDEELDEGLDVLARSVGTVADSGRRRP